MKGIINIDFIVSILVFVSTLSFVAISIISRIPLFHHEAYTDDLRSRTYQVSHLLLFDRGWPENWNEANVERIGLSIEPYILNRSKIDSLEILCSNSYEKVNSLLADINTVVTINITLSDGNQILSCGPRLTRTGFEVRRNIVVDDGVDKDVAKMVVIVQ